ncbi:MAG: SGNH/GDSL hydrolase family protein [Sedimenticola sp.]
MSAVLLTDSRFCGVELDPRFRKFGLNVKPGSQIKDHKKYVKKQQKRKSPPTIYVICVGINDIPDNLKDKTKSERQKLFVKITSKFRSLIKCIKKVKPSASIVVATIPPKDLLRSVTKYPHKSSLNISDITDSHQLAFEKFVIKVNDFIDNLNKSETGQHLPLHTALRTHRGRRGSTRFRYHKFTDGIHPLQSLKDVWLNKIWDCFQILQGVQQG